MCVWLNFYQWGHLIMLVLKSLKSWTYLLFGGSYNFYSLKSSLVLHQMEHPTIFLSLCKYFLLKIIFLQVSMFFDWLKLLKLIIYQSWRDMQISQLRFKKTMFEVQLVILLVNWICSSVAVSNRSDVSTRFNVRWHYKNVRLDSLGS